MHVPIETVRTAREAAERHQADSIIAFGGGSAMDTSKAAGLECELPIVAVPMTYGGSEVTPFYGYTEDGFKKGKRDRKMLPKTVIYDPALTVSLPANVSGPSGINAIAHCVEGLYAKDANPIMSLLAAEGIRALARSLPVVVRAPANVAARADALYGAWLASVWPCITISAMFWAGHSICRTRTCIRSSFRTPPHSTATPLPKRCVSLQKPLGRRMLLKEFMTLNFASAPRRL